MSKHGNSTEENNKDDLELEVKFIMRFSQDLAEALRESIETGSVHEKLTIQLDSEQRYGEVRMNDQVMHAKFVDLPTIVESYKTRLTM